MSRPWQTWLLFALCLAVVFGAMGWVSMTAARLERSEGEARRWAAQQENVRLALWRMDSAMAPLIVQESARPYFTYRAFYRVAPEIPFVTYISESVSEDGLGPSPLMTVQPPQVLLYFQFGPDGDLTSPQVPTGRFRGLAVPRFTTAERIAAASARLAQLDMTVKREALLADLPLQQTTPPLAPDLRYLYGGYAGTRIVANPPNASNAAPAPAQPQGEKQDQDQPPPNAASTPPQPTQPPQNPLAQQPQANRPVTPNAAQPQAQFEQRLQNQLPQQGAQQAPFAQKQQKVQAQIERNNEEFQARVTQNFHNTNALLLPQADGNGPITPNGTALKPPAQSEQPASNQPPQPPAVAQAHQEDPTQAAVNTIEYQARHMQSLSNRVVNGAPNPPAWNARELQEGVLKPLWVSSDLILARRVRVDGRDYIQGCLLDWPGIRESLLAGARPLLPQADLAAVTAPSADEVGHMMASLPVRLTPGPVPPEAPDGVSPVWLSLGIAWACVLAAAAGGAVVLARAISLSERRGAFVSAVTHELRTPLTTFKMYAEMLAEDMVPDEAKKRQYLQTLRTESVRLGHLVENVLAYARLERGRAAAAAETATLEALIARQRDRLAARAEQAGMQLVVEPGEHWQTLVRVDNSSVEQILFNLVDNACKYAGRATDRRIHIAAGRSDSDVARASARGAVRSGGFLLRKPRRFATLTVRDHGPGISQCDARRLFRAFHKSARDAANSAPGIGLGLALSRRLARRMGGGLRLDARPAESGACFALLLPMG